MMTEKIRIALIKQNKSVKRPCCRHRLYLSKSERKVQAGQLQRKGIGGDR